MRSQLIIKKLLLAFLICICFVACKKNATTKEFSLLELQRMSKLSTLKCSFKNVLVHEDEHQINLVVTAIPLPKEKYFCEYIAYANIGIDMKKISYNEATQTITIPKAEIIGEINYDLSSFNEKFYHKLIGSKQNVETITSHLKYSLDELKKTIESNDSIMNKAQNIAETQIEELINNVYTVAGKKPNFKYILE